MRDALRHQDVPFKAVVDALAAPRDPSRNPLFQVAFAMREYDPVDMRFEGTQVRRIDSGIERAKFDLTLTLIERPDRIDARWEYCADLFQRSTIERMSRQYATLIAAMAAAPAQAVATLPLMDAAARERIAADACRSSEAPSDSATIARAFRRAGARDAGCTGDRIADYADLDAAANRLAQELLAQGVAARAIVAVARRSSADIAVAWLAVLKAGAAYLPVDPDLPPERIAFMLADARVSHAIADEKLAGLFARPGVRVIVPEMEAERIAAHARRVAGDRYATGRSRLRDLHVGIDRIAEGSADPASRGAAARLRHGLRAARPRRSFGPDRESRVRRVDVRVLGRAPERREDRSDSRRRRPSRRARSPPRSRRRA